MKLGEIIDRSIAPFAPGLAARRTAARIGLDAVRQYEAAKFGDRRTKGWSRPASSADRENEFGTIGLRNGARDLVRNNKYASAAVKQMKAHMIGDGITCRTTHAIPSVAQAAQDEWDRFCDSKVYENRHDIFHVQKLIAGEMVEGGEALQLWLAGPNGPDSKIRVLEGDYLDSTKTTRLNDGGRLVQGVQFNRDNDRTHYHLFDEHPGDVIFGSSLTSTAISAEFVDHVYDEARPGQTRGVSWFASTALTLRDIADIEDARRWKEKVAACVALVLTPGEDSSASALAASEKQEGKKPDQETLRPGMIFRTKKGETATSLTPAASADGVMFIRQQLAAVSANLVPYHVLTGDVSQANYSSLRAALLAFWALLDDWQQQIIIPLCCRSAFDRRMRILALQKGDARLLQVKAQWAVPKRAFVDPVKDLMGEIMEIRAGLSTMTQAMSRRGIDVDKHLKEIERINGLLDSMKLALDIDPRKLTTAGILQAAAPYLYKTDTANQTE